MDPSKDPRMDHQWILAWNIQWILAWILQRILARNPRLHYHHLAKIFVRIVTSLAEISFGST
jgi:hypothetical protein